LIGRSRNLRILADSLSVGRLGDDRKIVLKAPAQQHLRGRPRRALRDPIHCLVGEVLAGTQRAVGLQSYVAPPASLEQRAPVLQRTELRLVNGGRDRPRR